MEGRLLPTHFRRRDESAQEKENQVPSTPKEIRAWDSFGQCSDEVENCWTPWCFDFQNDGTIKGPDTSFHTVRSAAGNVEVELDKALGLVADASKATGAIYILAGYNNRLRLSGFFITDRFFLTCGHYIVTETVEEVMKKSGSKMARVSTYRKPSRDDKTAHLVFRDKDRDFAIFRLNNDEQPHFHHLDLDRNFPGVDQLDFDTELANRRAFAIGYNMRGFAENFPQTRQDVIQDLAPEKRVLAQAATAMDPDLEFWNIFLPDRKTLSIGRLDPNPPERDATRWKHRITGWHGISGAMIACLDQSSAAGAKIQVLGLFSRGARGNNNNMVMLTSELVRAIRDVIQSYPSSD